MWSRYAVLLMLTGILLAAPCSAQTSATPQSSDDYPFLGTSFSGSVTVTDVDPDRDRLVVMTQGGQPLTIDTYSAQITLRNTAKEGETGDLMPEMRLHISGILLSKDIVMANSVVVLPLHTAPEAGPLPSKPTELAVAPQQVRLRGTVLLVYEQSQRFIVQVNNHTRTVRVDAQTQTPDIATDPSGNPDLVAGDRVSVVGVFLQDGTIRASLVTLKILPPLPVPSAPPVVPQSAAQSAAPAQLVRVASTPVVPLDLSDHLTGTVIDVANKYTSRDITVGTEDGRTVTVHVKRDAVVRRDGSDISMHDLKAGEEVAVDGLIDGSSFDADRVEAGTHVISDFRGADASASDGD